MFRPIVLLALFCLFSCNRAEDRLAGLQHDFWEHFARQDFFEIQLPTERLLLPLPPLREHPETQLNLAKKLLDTAQSIPYEALSPASQTQLIQLKAALDDLVNRTGGAFFDPSRCGLNSHLRRYTGLPERSVLLENIPAYYAEIERRWQTPDARYVPKAVDEALGSLELLEQIAVEKEGGASYKAVSARWAVKDFIGMCQSAALLR